MRLSIIFILIGLQIFAINGLSQGGWNIGYIEVDSIAEKDISRQVKIDFKRNYSLVQDIEKKSIRYFIEPQDTTLINIDGNTIKLIERRKIYVDHGNYNDQYLESLDFVDNRLMKIYNSEIVEVRRDSILFKLDLELYSKMKGKWISIPFIKTILSWIDKEKLDGVMYKLQ